jgi:peptidoglycan-associated lipoprotein
MQQHLKIGVLLVALVLSACNGKAKSYNEMYNNKEIATMLNELEKVGDRVFFDLNKSTLTPHARQVLEKQAGFMKKYPKVHFIVEGHCDERGTREYNLGLGERRANAVKEYLIGLGVDDDRLTTVSYGKERPAVTGSNEESWRQNRRAVTAPY